MKKASLQKMLAGFTAICSVASAMPVSNVTTAAAASTNVVYGDANCDSNVDISDAVLILQSISKPSVYGLEGTDESRITAEGLDNADVYERGSGITAKDALSIQRYIAGLCSLPESYQDGYVDPETDSVYIHLNNTSISVEGDSNGYAEVNGSTVTINHSGIYYVDGTLDDGQINVNIADETADPDTVKIFLNGASITGKSDSPFVVTNAEKTSINLVDGTTNTISDGDTAYTSGNAVIEAKDDLTIKGGDNGTGKLIVTANTQDGIVCNNDLKINNADVSVTTLNSTSGSKTNGINGKTSVDIKGTSVVTVDATSDGIKSTNGNVLIESGSVTVKAGADAVQSGTTIDISGGSLVAGGDRGLTAASGVNITGGTVIATATDNQAEGISSENQATLLLNCIDSSESDACWKKANSISVGDVSASFTKKYKYVLISDASIKTGSSYSLTNASTGAIVTHSNDTATDFSVTDSVTTFETVNPAGKSGSSTTDPTTEGYTITLSGTSIQTNAPADVATVSGGVITIIKEGVFTVTGTASEGQIVVDVDKTAYPSAVVELDLAGISLTNTSTSPIYVASIGDEVQIVSKNGTENTISDGTNYTNADDDQGAIYSKDDIKFKGKGTLTVNGNAADAIVSKDDLRIYNGTLIVNAVDDGIRGKDSVRIGNPDDLAVEGAYDNLSVTVKTNSGSTGGDGIKSTNSTDSGKGYVEINGGTVNINSYSDGIQGEQSVTINGGDITIYTYQGGDYTGSGSSSGGSWGGGWGGMGGMQDGNSNKTDISAKGIKAVGIYDTDGTTWQSVGDITINGGTLNIDSSDDSVHCGGDMNIYGGIFTVATADDGFHADHNLTIGKTAANTFDDVQIFISKCYEGVEAPIINQNSGTVYIISTDDGYNASDGSDSSSYPGGGPGQGWGQGSTSSSSDIAMNINGGFVCVNSANGDHDAFDSNGNINLNGGYICANGQEPLDCGDNGSTINYNGTSVITMTAGNTNLSSRYSFVDNSGNVIVSFLSASGSPGQNCTNCTAQSGGTVSGGSTVLSQSGDYAVTIGGTLSGATQITSSSSGGGSGRPGQNW